MARKQKWIVIDETHPARGEPVLLGKHHEYPRVGLRVEHGWAMVEGQGGMIAYVPTMYQPIDPYPEPAKV